MEEQQKQSLMKFCEKIIALMEKSKKVLGEMDEENVCEHVFTHILSWIYRATYLETERMEELEKMMDDWITENKTKRVTNEKSRRKN